MAGGLLLAPTIVAKDLEQDSSTQPSSSKLLLDFPLPEEKTRVAARLATRLFSAMHGGVWGIGADFKKASETLLATPRDLRKEVAWCYNEHYQRNLAEDFKSEFSTTEAAILSSLMRGRDITAAACLVKHATSKFISDKEMVFDVLSHFDQGSLGEIEESFERMYGDSLKHHLQNKFSGWELEVIHSILAGDKIGALVNRCHAAIHKFLPDSEELLEAILKLPKEEKEGLSKQYLALYRKSISQDADRQLPKLWADAFKAALQGEEFEAQILKLLEHTRAFIPSAEKIATHFLGKSAEQRDLLLRRYRSEVGRELPEDLSITLSAPEFEMVSHVINKGQLSDCERLVYLFGSGRARFSEVLEIFHRYTREEIRSLREEYENHTGRILRADLSEHFWGRNLVQLRLALYGRPKNELDESRRVNLERRLEEKGLGYYLTLGISWKGWRLRNSGERLEKIAQMESTLEDSSRQSEDLYLTRTLEYVRADLHGLQEAKDTVVNRIASIGASTVGAAALISGASLPVLVPAVALAAGLGYLGAKKVLRGALYDKENTLRDFAIGAVDGAVSAAAVGTGQYLHSMLGKAGKSSAQELLKRGLEDTVSGGLASAAEGGVSTSFQGAAFGLITNVLKQSTWQGGVVAGLKKVGISFVTDGASGSVGRMGALLARYRPKSPLSA